MVDPHDTAVALVRRAAQLILSQPADLMERLDHDLLAIAPEAVRQEPLLAAEVAASTRSNIVHWARYAAADPLAPIPLNVSPEVINIVRDAVRLGAEPMIRQTYHAGQNLAWRFCMQLAFEMSSDPAVLRDALDIAARSIFAFVDDMISALEAQIDKERTELTRGTHAERFEVVTLIIEGGAPGIDRASERLAYELRQRHTGAVIWAEPAHADHGELARAAEALSRAAGARRPLTVVASASSLWVWFAAAADADPRAMRDALDAIPGVRAALGEPADGLDGFRRTHLEAAATQRLMYRLAEDLRVASYADVQLVALASQDEERAATFVARTLGDLATADAELRHTLRVYIDEGFSASRAARTLFAHRNTVLNRLARAERLLPAPLAHRGVEVGLALELVRWLGPRVGGGDAAAA